MDIDKPASPSSSDSSIARSSAFSVQSNPLLSPSSSPSSLQDALATSVPATNMSEDYFAAAVLPAPTLQLPAAPRQRKLRPASLDISVAERESLAVGGCVATPHSATSLSFLGSPVPEAVRPISAAELAALRDTTRVLVVDVRPLAQFAVSRVVGAVNVCMPTTLLKRPTFVLARFLECMSPAQKSCLGDLAQYGAVVLYDQACKRLSPSHTTLVYTLRKFHQAVDGQTPVYWLRGGIAELAPKYDKLIDATATSTATGTATSTATATPLVSGISLPEAATLRNPFATNIRTAMEVYDENDGVDIVLPRTVDRDDDAANRRLFPEWLCRIVRESQHSKTVARLFFDIEMAEKTRLQQALTARAGEPAEGMLAGVELGAKNRYTNIWPFDHSRVRLRDSAADDYINASYVSARGSQRRYIATQGPLPATYEDFWKVVWHERVPVILMLTPEHEGGTRKCDLYWRDGVMGDIELRRVATTSVQLGSEARSEVVVRRFRLRNARDPAHTLETVQIHYADWPDLGAPASPEDLLALSRLKEEYLAPARQAQGSEPLCLVHCSAGCGRTGTFCTVDTATDIFERHYRRGAMPDFDVVHQVVHDLRRARISMVQNLRQYGMCYEALLQWCVDWAANH